MDSIEAGSLTIQRISRFTSSATMMTKPLPVAMICAVVLAAAPAVGQQRPQDFQLPPAPTPTPPVEGPIDDSGPIPIAPRAIPTGSPTPSPAASPTQLPTPAPTPAPSGSPVVQEIPETQPTTASAPERRTVPSPTSVAETPAGRTAPTIADEATPLVDNATTFTPEPRSTVPATVGAPKAPILPDWWPWAAGLLAALIIGGIGGWWTARRRGTPPAPQIEPPIVADAARPSLTENGPARLHLNLEAEHLMRSMMMLTLKYRLTISNRSDRALRDVSVYADLIGASRNLPVEQQVATADTQLPSNANIERIGPNQSASLTGTLQLPLNEIEVFQQGQVQLSVPLVRLRVDADGVEPQLRTFLIGPGSAGSSGRVHPLPLSGPPGGYEGIRTRLLE